MMNKLEVFDLEIVTTFLKKSMSTYLSLRHALSSIKNKKNNIEIIDLEEDPSEINRRIKTTEKEYIGFADSNATYEENYFEKLLTGFSLYNKAGAVRGMIKTHNGKKTSFCKNSRKAYLYFDTSSNYENILIVPDGAVFKTEIIRNNDLLFDENMKYCNDIAFAVKYQEIAGGFVQLNNEHYKTGRILDESSPDTPQSSDSRWYTDSLSLINLLKGADQRCSKQAQFAMLYTIIQRFKSNQNDKVKMAFEDPEDVAGYISDTGRVLKYVSDEVLFSKASPLKWEQYKKIYLAGLRKPEKPLEFTIRYLPEDAALFLKGGDEKSEICRITNIYFNIVTIHLKEKEGTKGLELVLKNPRCFPLDSYRMYFVNSQIQGEGFSAEYTGALAGEVTFFDRYAARQDAFRAFVPLKENVSSQSISLIISMGDDEHVIQRKIGFSDNWQNKINSGLESSYWYKDGFVFRVSEGKIIAEKSNEINVPEYERRYIEDLKTIRDKEKNPNKKELISNVISWREAYRNTYEDFKGRRIWAYYDKVYKAGDNGEYAIRYAAGQDDGIEKLFYIDPDCNDWNRLKSQGYKVIDPNSMEGILIAMHAEVIYMTHIPPYRKLGIPDSALKYVKDLLDAKVIRLYHGFPITRSSSYAQISDDAVAVAICSSYEKELYTDEDNCYIDSQIIASGMPRYDDLISENKRQILFAPTWRPSLTGKVLLSGATLYNEEFKNSLYYKMYAEILSDPKVIETARQTGYKLIMFLHPTLSEQTCDFEKNDVVDSLSCTQDIDYVTIMKQSDLMVTDYSSVQYDFAYMRKPVLYFHAPELPYWRKINFDYEKLGFGEICRNTGEMADLLCEYMLQDCKLKPYYEERIDDFFIHSDHSAGKRLYESTIKIVEQS